MKRFILLILVSGLAACTKPPMLSTAKTAAEASKECHAYSEDKDFEHAAQCLELLKSRYAGTPEAADAEIELADNSYHQKDYLIAADAYKTFAKLHPTHSRIDYVYYRTGLSYLKESPKGIDRDQEYLDDAIHYFVLTLNTTGSQYRDIAREKWVEARQRLARRSYYIARFYYRSGEYLSAIPRFEEIVTKFSELGLDEKALYFLGRSYDALGKKDKALEIVSVFDQHFPGSKYRKKLAGKIGIK